MTASLAEEPTITVSLTLKDRCDSECGAAARTRWESPVAQELQFCGHHTRKNGPALTVAGWRVNAVNESAALELLPAAK